MGKSNMKIVYIASMLIFGSIGLFVRRLPIPSLHIAFLRSLIGTFVLILIYTVMGKKIDRRAIQENRYYLILAGAFLGINWILLFEAYKRTTITSATLAYYMAPVIFILLSALVFRLRITGVRALTISLSFAGLCILLMKDLTTYGNMKGEGIAFGLLAAFFYALVIILNRKMKKVSGLDRTLMELMVSLLILGVYMLLTGEFQRFQVPLYALPYAVILGVVHTGLAYYLYFSTVDKLDSQHVALFSYIDPLSAMLFSAAFLKETIYFNMAMGALLILGSSVLFDLIGKKEQRRSS